MKAAVSPTVKIAELEQRVAHLEKVLDGVVEAAIWLTGLSPIDAPAWPEMREKINRGLDERK